MARAQWYMVTVVSSKEEMVIDSLKNRVKSEGMEDFILKFKVAMIPYKNRFNKIKKKNLFPGYIFIQMDMTNEAWFMIRNTKYVTGLVGSSGQRTKPTPISSLEINKIDREIKKIEDEISNSSSASVVVDDEFNFKVGEPIRVKSGPMKDHIGPILSIDLSRKVAIVEFEVFGRKTPTELSFSDIDKSSV